MKKLRCASGETLVETLAAILIVTLASLLFLQMTMASVRINRDARQMDADYQAALAAAEDQRERTADSPGTATLSGSETEGTEWSYSIDYYGGGNLTSYAARG